MLAGQTFLLVVALQLGGHVGWAAYKSCKNVRNSSFMVAKGQIYERKPTNTGLASRTGARMSADVTVIAKDVLR